MSDYPIFAVTADVVLFAGAGDRRSVLVIRRGRDPYAGALALPGGFVDIDEDLSAAAHRELTEETGVAGVELRQLGTYGTPGRDPRGRTVSVVYLGQLAHEVTLSAGDDAAEAHWLPVADVLASPDRLAFDHDVVLRDALAVANGQIPQATES